MAINGIETIIYGVEDVALCTRYFVDFGLPLVNPLTQRPADATPVAVAAL